MIQPLSDNQPGNILEPALPFQKIFETRSGQVLVLSPELVIQAATNGYLTETLTKRETIIGRHVFDVFPDNPNYTEASASARLKLSLAQAISTGEPQKIDTFRYDIPDPENKGEFLERYWVTTNTPIFNDAGALVCIMHETENVTDKEFARRQLQASKEREQQARAQADQHRLRLERLFEQAPAALAILEGPDLVYRVLNSAYQQLFPGRQLMGLGLFDALPELKDSPVYEIIYNVYHTGETFEGKEILIPVARFENQLPEDIYWNFIYQAIFDEQGQVNGILIFALDVTPFVETRRNVEKSADELRSLNQELEKRVAERTNDLLLAQAETQRQWLQLEDLFMRAPSAVCILDGPEFSYQLINPVYQQIFPGRSLLGKPLLKALPELEGSAILEMLDKVYTNGETYVAHDFPLMMARHEGQPLEEIYWTFTYVARRNINQQVDGVLVFAHEVTDQVMARKSIEDNANQLRLITDSLPVLISYIDKEEYYRFANKAYENWFHLKPEDIVGKKLVEVIGEKAYHNVKDKIHRVLAGERLDFEATMPYREGFTKHISTSYVPNVQNNQVVGFYTLVSDITEQVESRKKVENSVLETQNMARELAKANEELRIANEDLATANQQLIHTNVDLDNFIYTASHDLKAPISNIEMLLQELEFELPAENLKHADTVTILNLIKNAIERFKKTVFNLTEISKLQKENISETKLVDCSELVQEVLLDLEPLINSTGAQIKIAIDEQTKLSFSEKNLRSIIYNLLSNAIKYAHPDRKPQVNLSFQKQADNVVLSVQDNGLGLSKTNQGKLFNMFRRFHDHVEGTGIGLYMVKRIVDNAGGKIEVDSQPNEGSVFRVYLKESRV